ncbi:MAG TPA: peptide-methionine (S)-S-oxide reductase MsrA, partial [Methanofastidiosum sp.]|nr:peptide-methionine (S)-S-oxide reductase MsrA [Methanofastidiosum sp.]
TYEKLLELFWSIHDPTTLNRQGPDIGNQYRSIVFYHSEEQKNMAIYIKDKLEKSKRFSRKIVTEIIPSTVFYKAEEYHQKYFQKHGLVKCKSK